MSKSVSAKSGTVVLKQTVRTRSSYKQTGIIIIQYTAGYARMFAFRPVKPHVSAMARPDGCLFDPVLWVTWVLS